MPTKVKRESERSNLRAANPSGGHAELPGRGQCDHGMDCYQETKDRAGAVPPMARPSLSAFIRTAPMRLKQWAARQVIAGHRSFEGVARVDKNQAVVGEACFVVRPGEPGDRYICELLASLPDSSA